MHITGSRDGPPVKVGVAITDLTTGLYTSNSVMAALLGRMKTNRGQHIDVALSDTQTASLTNIASSVLVTGQRDTGRWGTAHRAPMPTPHLLIVIANPSTASIVPYRGFATSDGDLLIGGGNDRLFGILCGKLGKPEWAADDRFVTNNMRVKNRQELEANIEELTMQKTTQEWLDLLEGSGMPYARINDVKDTLEHVHCELTYFAAVMIGRCLRGVTDKLITAKARNMVTEIEHPSCGPMKLVNTPVKYSHSTPGIRSAPPTLGQHTDEVLKDILGMDKGEIDYLRKEGVVA